MQNFAFTVKSLDPRSSHQQHATPTHEDANDVSCMLSSCIHGLANSQIHMQLCEVRLHTAVMSDTPRAAKRKEKDMKCGMRKYSALWPSVAGHEGIQA